MDAAGILYRTSNTGAHVMVAESNLISHNPTFKKQMTKQYFYLSVQHAAVLPFH